MMKKFLSLIVCSLMLVSCIEDSKVTAEPQISVQPKLQQQPKANVAELVCKNRQFPSSEAVDKTAIGQSSFLQKCASVIRLVDVQMTGASTILLCHMQWKRDGEALAEAYQKANILNAHYMLGRNFTILMLLDEKQKLAKEIIHREEFDSLSVTLETANAALAWGYLSGNLGREFDSSALCGSSVTEDDSGWKVANANVFAKNCAPREKRDIAISRVGEVKILKNVIDPNEPALCID